MYVCISCTIRAFLMHSGCSRRVPMAVNLPVRRSTLLLLLSLHNCICCCYCCCCSCLEHLWSALAKGSESAAVVGALCLCSLAICNIYIRVYLFPSFFLFCILCPSATFSSSAAPSGPVGGGLLWVGLSSTGHQRHQRSAQVLFLSALHFHLLFYHFPRSLLNIEKGKSSWDFAT